MEDAEKRAIGFLRALIQTNEREKRMPDGIVDAGWCCMEHAWTSSMMFCLLGIRTHLCQGMAIVGNKTKQTQVMPHFFNYIEDEPQGIFDSSFEYNSVKGITRMPSPLRSHITVAFYTSKPDLAIFRAELKKTKTPILLLYAARHKMPLDETILNRVSTTPFGNWLAAKFGTQEGLFAKAAFYAAEVYEGRMSFDASAGRDKLWDEVSRISEKRDVLRERLSILRR